MAYVVLYDLNPTYLWLHLLTFSHFLITLCPHWSYFYFLKWITAVILLPSWPEFNFPYFYFFISPSSFSFPRARHCQIFICWLSAFHVGLHLLWGLGPFQYIFLEKQNEFGTKCTFSTKPILLSDSNMCSLSLNFTSASLLAFTTSYLML